MQNIIPLFQKLGISEKETIAYLACLRFDTASILDIARETQLKRPTCYVVLEELNKKQLVTITKSDKGIRYRAVPPEYLLFHVEQLQRDLKQVLPYFTSLQKEKDVSSTLKILSPKEWLIQRETALKTTEPREIAVLLAHSGAILSETLAYLQEEKCIVEGIFVQEQEFSSAGKTRKLGFALEIPHSVIIAKAWVALLNEEKAKIAFITETSTIQNWQGVFRSLWRRSRGVGEKGTPQGFNKLPGFLQ